MKQDFDAIIVGAGHNGLITAAYLAKAGYKVGVFERRSMVGGAVSTQEIVPDYHFDLGGSAHILIRLTPIIEELELEKFGLKYVELDPVFFAPFKDNDAVFFYRSAEKTIDHLESKFPGEGEAYKRFLTDWTPFAKTVKEVFLSTPSPFELGKKFIFGKAIQGDWKKALPMILKPYGDVVDSYFKEEKIKSPMVWMAAQSGPPPTEPLNAPFLLWHPLYHEGGAARPIGGSGMLTQALQRQIEYYGGTVFVDSPVKHFIVSGKQVVGIHSQGTDYTAKAVISGTHALETFTKLLPPAAQPEQAKSLRVGNGFGAILRLALDKPIEYAAHTGVESRIALQLLCENRHEVNRAFGHYLKGEPTPNPPIVAMSFSAVDGTLAPPGGEVLWLWAQYFPYELQNGHWDDLAPAVAENILDTFEQYAPGTKASVVGSLFQHPLWLERELGLYRANVMHLEMTLDQMFMLRPMLGMSEYKTHLKGLYITGASTHPGGGIMGASGRNAARIVLKDLEKKRL